MFAGIWVRVCLPVFCKIRLSRPEIEPKTSAKYDKRQNFQLVNVFQPQQLQKVHQNTIGTKNPVQAKMDVVAGRETGLFSFIG